MLIPRSAIPGVLWPAVPDHPGALRLAMQEQLRRSERLPAAELEALQFRALAAILRHGRETVPFYRDHPGYAVLRPGEALNAESWRRVPLLTRAQVQEAGAALLSERLPADHLPQMEVCTSGSTGRPVRAVGTAVTALFWQALTLREHLWHRRDLGGRLAGIRAETSDSIPPEGLTAPGWGPATDAAFECGPASLYSIQHDVGLQADWLMRQDPDYLITYPSNLLALARHCAARALRPARLRQVRTYGETLGPEVREACAQAWGVGVADVYSTQEVGYIALQCPDHEHYHVQSESLYVEVLDEQDRPCPPGHAGRVVVSALHNWAMPLLRYEVGDWALPGEPCACGRELPVLSRVLGRTRNMLRLPDGRRVWPTFPVKSWGHIGEIRQLQLVQDAPEHIEARIVGPRPLTGSEEAEFTAMIGRRFGYPFQVSFAYPEAIARSPSLKFEDFVSLLDPPEEPRP